jgi:hypothetical protein
MQGCPPLRKGAWIEEDDMKTKLLGLVLLAGTSLFAQPRAFFGLRVGYAPAPVAVYAAPPAPRVAYAAPIVRPGYSWVGGYYYPAGAGWNWQAGYYARPPYVGARWVAPRYYSHRYYGGYWRR